ncbi:parg [Sucra jujuba nucleopolyhedrovirus]|uniref:Parg n=1 Tax=Sucra jujuba nucleopolyhedrovirus TaxID=1563660 RepID=A0A097P929_9ABAC|nr:parg [Sucra jujuba nucleopolyhedrovirus]AIU41337.1 parg [Sucra jujuba nucleopolyhedrovirus]
MNDSEVLLIKELYSLQERLLTSQNIFLEKYKGNNVSSADYIKFNTNFLQPLQNEYLQFRQKLIVLDSSAVKQELMNLYASDISVLTNLIILVKNVRLKPSPDASVATLETDDFGKALIEEVTDINETYNVAAQQLTKNLRSPRAMPPSPPTMIESAEAAIQQFNQFARFDREEQLPGGLVDHRAIYDKIVTYGNLVNENHWKDFKYQPELMTLIEMSDVIVENGKKFAVTRLQCASIVSKAMFVSKESIFKTLKAQAVKNQILRVKLYCLLEYINSVCQTMRHGSQDELNELVYVERHKAAAPFEMSTSKIPIMFNRIFVHDVDAPASGDLYSDIPLMDDLIVMYSENDFYAGNVTDKVNAEEIHFFEYPELFAIKLLIVEKLGDTESLLLCQLLKVNSIEYVSHNKGIEYKENILINRGRILNNFLVVRSDTVRFDRDGDHIGVDKASLQRHIDRYSSGLSQYRRMHSDSTERDDQELVIVTVYVAPENVPRDWYFQFLLEIMVVMQFQLKIFTSAKQMYVVQMKELLATMKANGIDTVGALYNRLVNYNFRVQAVRNFQR